MSENIISQFIYFDRVDDPQGADSGEKGQASEVAKKAEEAGYRKTYSPDFFYDEKTKKHMKYNSESGKFEEVPNLTSVDRVGNQTYTIPLEGGNIKTEIKKSGTNTITNLSVKNNNKTYDAAESAKILGLAPTWGKNKGVYYNKETRQHFIWDEKNHQFIVAEQIKQMNADGTYYDYSGKLHNL